MRNILARGAGFMKNLNISTAFKLRDVEFFAQYRTPVICEEVSFVESGAGTYTGTIPLPANSRIIDIGLDGQVLWNSAGAVAAVVGDGASANGFFTSTDLKATDLLAGEINNIEHPGGKAGTYIASEQRKLFQATARNIIGVITVASGAGSAGRTRLYCVYTVVDPRSPIKT